MTIVSGIESEKKDFAIMAENNKSERKRTFFDITIGGLPAGRIVFELFTEITPKTVENFRALCTGELSIPGKITGKRLHYKGVIFHRVVKNFMIQSGDFSAGNGTGGESIYGSTFDDESFAVLHDKPFLLSMANRGKGTNGSQFFITTQPAPHLDNIHVVFGQVVSGQELVRQIEQLPVDRNSRPLQDVIISNCDELVKQRDKKSKPEKRKNIKRSEATECNSSSESDESDQEKIRMKEKKEKKKKKKKKQKKKSKEVSQRNSSSSTSGNSENDPEEGEIEEVLRKSRVDPKGIPEVSNSFLMRGDRPQSKDRISESNKHDKRDRQSETKRFGWSKRKVPLSRSGRVIKGRGVFRYRTPSRSRSRSRSITPPHWKQAQKRVIKYSDFERVEEEKKTKEAEIKRREFERKIRHEKLAREGKKSFFELQMDTNVGVSVTEEGEIDEAKGNFSRNLETVVQSSEKNGLQKCNDKGAENDLNALDYEAELVLIEPEMRSNDSSMKKNNCGNGKDKSSDEIELETKKDSKKQHSDLRNHRSRKSDSRSYSRERPHSKRGERQKTISTRRRYSPYRGNDRTGTYRTYRERRHHSRSTSRSHRFRRRDSRTRERRHRKRSEEARSQSRSHDNDRKIKSSPREIKLKEDNNTNESNPFRQSGDNLGQKFDVSTLGEKERINREKMLKRVEALEMLKDHMRKEIEEQERRQAEKERLKESETALEIARLERIKRETLDELKDQEKQQMTAVKRVLEAVASTVKKKVRISRSSSSSSSESSNSSSTTSKSRNKGNQRRSTDSSSSD